MHIPKGALAQFLQSLKGRDVATARKLAHVEEGEVDWGAGGHWRNRGRLRREGRHGSLWDSRPIIIMRD